MAPTQIEKPPDSAHDAGKLANPLKRAEIQFVRDDWTLFRSVSTLPQRTGVAPELLRRLVIKELTDNALDEAERAGTSGSVNLGRTASGGYCVEDLGSGIDPEALAEMFSIARPLISSKTIRLPYRGALGNGLRVVAGAVLASGGSLQVWTRGHHVRLVPKDDGTAEATIEDGDRAVGTRVEVTLGDAIPEDDDHDVFAWAGLAHMFAGKGSCYRGKSSAWWYGADAFFELLQAAGARSVRDLVSELEGCSGRNAGLVAGAHLGRRADALTRDEAADLLAQARHMSRRVNPSRLGAVGQLGDFPWYVKRDGRFEVGDGRGTPADVPFVLEAWARPDEEDSIAVCVNRTPITAKVDLWRRTEGGRTSLGILGCNLNWPVQVSRTTVPLGILVNVQTPYMPITHEGKAPDLRHMLKAFEEAVGKLARKARRGSPSRASGGSQKDCILGVLDAAIEKVSGGGTKRFSLRQLFYAVRPHLLDQFGEPDYKYYGQVIGDHEAELGHDIPGMYRANRGMLYHPHTGQEIPLGTLSAEGYRRPSWSFNKVVYGEKEGLVSILRQARWPERNDCALATTQGFANRAVRDIFDALGDTDEEIAFYCVHDADGPGTMIYQALQEGTRARPGRRFRIVNLGLEPEEGRDMGLQVEPVRRKKGRAVAVARYVPEEERDWLQGHRIELDAMTTPQLIKWLDGKMEGEPGKVVPPAKVMEERLFHSVRARLRQALTDEILREAGLDRREEEAFLGVKPALSETAARLETSVRAALEAERADPWTSPVDRIAEDIVRKGWQGELPPPAVPL